MSTIDVIISPKALKRINKQKTTWLRYFFNFIILIESIGIKMPIKDQI